MNPPRRRSTRLSRFDYARQGAYFVTLCTRNRACLFGDIQNGEMRLNETGELANKMWNEIPTHFPHVEIDASVIMPNHLHGVIVIPHAPVGATHASPLPSGPPKRSLGAIIGAYKSAVSRHANRLGLLSGLGLSRRSIWQRNYYDHVIRDDASLARIRQYIADNPFRWPEDPENPARQHASLAMGPWVKR